MTASLEVLKDPTAGIANSFTVLFAFIKAHPTFCK